jgi:hypothetical protein
MACPMTACVVQKSSQLKGPCATRSGRVCWHQSVRPVLRLIVRLKAGGVLDRVSQSPGGHQFDSESELCFGLATPRI